MKKAYKLYFHGYTWQDCIYYIKGCMMFTKE